MLTKLEDKIILEAYQQSVELQLDVEFISLLKDELVRRGLLDNLQSNVSS
ncbi:sporulation histidine kinase inhibitor Sda [Halalkalibacter alkaliphilus]|uniref:Sporulation histidine kinase inhibitor Sda n=1 Tax=Halalkalibacter alkaliphilus TaxID=2917993 RepID=A0A9X2CRY4_9BACI|nr:sporulation histidine kinase inhibitor Sda [Halalkalibacter alkaliphilus]MCL7747108.1 sporulation histidine kinase inhibitor Sda [Halalkalibacter alkaliphilus]